MYAIISNYKVPRLINERILKNVKLEHTGSENCHEKTLLSTASYCLATPPVQKHFRSAMIAFWIRRGGIGIRHVISARQARVKADGQVDIPGAEEPIRIMIRKHPWNARFGKAFNHVKSTD